MEDGEVPQTSTDMIMFHKATKIDFPGKLNIDVTFQNGEVKRYNVSNLFDKYPSMKALEDINLFRSGKLVGHYGIIWNDELDLEVETIYEEGELIRTEAQRANVMLAYAIAVARAQTGMTQKDLSEITGIDQSDISKIERGVANPSVNTLERIAEAMGRKLQITFIA